jgi:hypothetical protein
MLNVKVYIQTVDMFANVDHVIDVYFQFFPLYLLEVMCVCFLEAVVEMFG